MKHEIEYISFKESVDLFLDRTMTSLKSEDEVPALNFLFPKSAFKLFEYVKNNPLKKEGRWYSSITEKDIIKALPENNQNPSLPTVIVKNPVLFFELLTDIINLLLDHKNKYYGAISARALFISSVKRLWLRMSPSDFTNVEKFLQQQLNFLKSNIFDEFIKKEIEVGEYEGYKVIVKKEDNPTYCETNEKLVFYLEDEIGNIHSLPSIYFSISENGDEKTCYIYAIQHENISIRSIDKKIQRKIYKLYKDQINPSVHPNFILSLKIFIKMLENVGIYNVKVPLLQVLSYRYHEIISQNEKLNFPKKWNSDTLERLNYLGEFSKEYKLNEYLADKTWYDHVVDKEDFISKNKTEALLNIMYQASEILDFEIINDPFIEDENLNIKIKNNSKIKSK